MLRVFTQDIRNANGDIKFANGESREWPKFTWQELAKSLGKSLDEFSVLATEGVSLLSKQLAAVNSSRDESVKATKGRRTLA